MAKKVYKKSGNKINRKTSTPQPWLPVVIFAVAVFIFCLVIIPGENLWLYMHNFIFGLFGVCSILWPVLLGCVSALEATGKSCGKFKSKICLSVITIMISCSIFYVFSKAVHGQINSNIFEYIINQYKQGLLNGSSGLLGAFVGTIFVWAFGIVGARITSVLCMFVCLMILTSTTLVQFFGAVSKPVKVIKSKAENRRIQKSQLSAGSDSIDIDIGPKRKFKDEPELKEDEKQVSDAEDISKVTQKFLARFKCQSEESSDEKTEKANSKDGRNGFEAPQTKNSDIADYKFPSVDLLRDTKSPDSGDITQELNNNGKMLVDTLKSFNVNTKIIDISRGPAVTRYELQPAAGVKISKITTLADDIALNLAASGVRIEAPIPGKAAVGIEIPNKVVSMVGMKELIASSEFKHAKSKLTVVLGRDISGNIMTADLAKMPHLLIAGSTGSGKSVCINSFIISILYNASPNEVKMLMIDPKVVELGVYNGIPNLLVPVVTDPRKAAGALNWAVNEMLVRYKKFAETGVRDLESYNKMIEENPDIKDESGEVREKMPQIVIIIDELSDLMMAAPNEVEDYICRLAQMARAAGMHLVIATQRPSVDVITGIIKANIPSRIALAVSSQIDSRTILDMSGAEKLLGRGDMLFAPVGVQKPIRVQGCYVTDKEIERVVEFIKQSHGSNYDDKIAEEIEKGAIPDSSAGRDSQSEGSTDPMMSEAIKCVIEAGQASTSLLQRRLRVGYARAGRLVDEMEQMGIVGPHEGSKPRQVLINYQQFLEMNINKAD